MSIIEKAAGRLDQGKAKTRPVVAPDSTAHRAQEQRQSASHGASPRRQETSAAKPVAKINLAQLRQLGIATPDAGRTMVAEEFRSIKRPLIRNAFGHGADAIPRGNLIMVTSAMPGEGKTFCSVNLAMSIATEMDHRVLLVDADMLHPSVLDTLGLKSDVGLTDVLTDENTGLEDVLMKTSIERLSILPAGKNHKHLTELLASQATSNLLAEMSARYPDRIIIFDAPPLLVSSEARVLATHMGQIVVVVEAEATTQQALNDALHQIETCTNISLVCNKGSEPLPGGHHRYYSN